MSAQDDLKIFMNILAQSPNGLSDPDLIGKFSKSKAMMNAMSSMDAMRAQQPIIPPSGTILGTLGGQPPQSPTEPLGAVNTLNQPTEQPIQ